MSAGARVDHRVQAFLDDGACDESLHLETGRRDPRHLETEAVLRPELLRPKSRRLQLLVAEQSVAVNKELCDVAGRHLRPELRSLVVVWRPATDRPRDVCLAVRDALTEHDRVQGGTVLGPEAQPGPPR